MSGGSGLAVAWRTAGSVLAASMGAPEAALDVTGQPPAMTEMPALAEARCSKPPAARDPEVLMALAQLKADEEKTRSIGAEMRPDLSFTTTLSARAGGAASAPGANDAPAGGGWLPEVPNWDVGLILNWPLFDGTVAARASGLACGGIGK